MVRKTGKPKRMVGDPCKQKRSIKSCSHDYKLLAFFLVAKKFFRCTKCGNEVNGRELIDAMC
jgi:hypothetical protein